ncbi:MAG: tRNA pseudouridine(38-40) synthase TruA [Candidatus Goldbacteria bacterium]|nr:tRNA pseudouridine(38-40) synthase TruA [Candidatus Goldiibacteriota bacterium]
MSKKIFKCVVAYNGTNYYGWQRQKDAPTIQGTIEYTLSKFFNREIKIIGASRTDAGVHAFGQVFSFQIDIQIPAANIKSVLNDLLPPDIRIISVNEVNGNFNPRYNVKEKFYRYVIYNGKLLYPFYNNFCWHITQKINTEKICSILNLFEGEKNYFSFSGSGTDYESYIRKINKIKIKTKEKWIFIDFFAKSFLNFMIRKITGTLISFSFDKIKKEDIERMFEIQNRTISNTIAPAQGLYLVKIIYERISKKSEELEENDE